MGCIQMKFKFNNKYVNWGLTAFFVIVAGAFACYLIFNGAEFLEKFSKIFSVLMPIAVGLIIAYLLSPIVNFLESKLLYPLFDKIKWKSAKLKRNIIRTLSILITIVLVFAVIYVLVAMLVSQIVPSIEAIVLNFDGYIQNFMNWINNLPIDNAELEGYVSTFFAKIMSEVDNWLNDTAKVINQSGEILKTLSMSVISILGVLWDVVIGLIISIYVLASKETFISQAKKIVFALFKTSTANVIVESMRFTHKTFSGFINGKILDSLIIGILCFVCTSLMGTPYAALVSVIIGVTNVIPFFGPFLGAIPCAILILIVDLSNPLNCVYFLIFILALQQFDGNFLGPLILGDSTGLSGFWVIFSITAFGGLFGVPGMVIGVPAFAVFYAVVRGLVNVAIKKKELPQETKVYFNLKAVDENGEIEEYKDSDAKYKGENKRKTKKLFKKKSKAENCENINK